MTLIELITLGVSSKSQLRTSFMVFFGTIDFLEGLIFLSPSTLHAD